MKINDQVTVFGLASSQPTRTVLWFCLQAGIPINFVSSVTEKLGISPGIYEFGDHFGAENYRKISPLGKVPAIMLDDFKMSESLAITTFLCDHYGLNQFYPKSLKTRTKLNQYLLMHDTLTREATVTIRPFMRGAWGAGVAEELFAETRLEGQEIAHGVAKAIEDSFLDDQHDYLMGMNHVSIADIACYEEIRQVEWAGISDFSDFARLRRWFDIMQDLPYHDEAHRFNFTLGDICNTPMSMERYISANLAAHKALEELGNTVTPLSSFTSQVD